MVRWSDFVPSDIQYDFETDKLAVHHVTFEEAVECFFGDFELRRNKRYPDRYQLIGETFGGTQAQDYFPTQAGQGSPNNHRVAAMNSRKKKTQKRVSEKEIDLIVESEAGTDSAWDKPVQVRKVKPASLPIPAGLAVRAAFLAKLHKERNEDWLNRIIKERVELEEVAFTQAKREMLLRTGTRGG